MAWATPPTFSAGATLGASQLNILSGDLTTLGGPWTVDGRAASAVWQAATTNPAIGNGTFVSRYIKGDKLLVWQVQITSGSTTTYGSGTWFLIPPFSLNLTIDTHVTGIAADVSTGDNYPIWYQTQTATQLNGRALVATAATGPVKFSTLAATVPITWATGDRWTLQGIFELA